MEMLYGDYRVEDRDSAPEATVLINLRGHPQDYKSLS